MDEKVCLLYIIIYIKEYDKIVDILYRKRCLYVGTRYKNKWKIVLCQNYSYNLCVLSSVI